MKFSRLVLAAAPLAALTVACGTPSHQPPATASSATTSAASSATTSAASTAARFAAAADRVCAVQNQQELALGNGLINADLVSVAHLPKAAHYLQEVVAIRRDGLTELHQLAAAGTAADQARQQAFVQAYGRVITDYQDAAQAALQGDMAAFRADFGQVVPHGYPTGPDAKALDRAAAPFPFKACGMSGGL